FYFSFKKTSIHGKGVRIQKSNGVSPYLILLIILFPQVISDFDMTLTRFAHNGMRVPTTHSKHLLNTYYPIEIDAGRSTEEKLPLMVECFCLNLCNTSVPIVPADMYVCVCREGYKVFFDHLAEHHIPLLIFSAGVGDVLEEVIRQNHVFHPNINIISNYMDFDHTGVLQAFKGQLIHTFNKRQGALSHAAHLRQVQDRPNVLLLGDSLGDLTMADGVTDTHNILTIGFLNDQVEERKESYINSFDIVLVKDETMDIPNAIVKYVTSSRYSK
uniref:5'-nucleotidase, cytosolic IIIB n=1 Tax=Sphaeramia orbicularis TaxID=375764 RepID=A0A673AP80_9TELE